MEGPHPREEVTELASAAKELARILEHDTAEIGIHPTTLVKEAFRLFRTFRPIGIRRGPQADCYYIRPQLESGNSLEPSPGFGF